MSLHKLTAGSGYDYLTRQVAALDATDKGHVGLASYYTERGESPGVWVGSGMAGIDGLDVGDPVTAEQMRALFGCGLHPLAELRLQQLEGRDLTGRDFQDVMRLGAPFKIIDDATPFRVEVAQRIAALNAAIGEPVDASVAAADRARIRTQVAREFFAAEHGRAPIDAWELAGQIAKSSRPRAQTVAGFDLTFSPVKSVSTLWAVAEPAVAAAIERAHQAAVRDALSFIEQQALFTRTGPQGIRQVNVHGLVAARSLTATAGPATRICTPMSRWRTRCRPSTGAGGRSTAGCCSRQRLPPRKPTTPPWSNTSATRWECDSRRILVLIRASGRSGKLLASTRG
jgi:TrwC relaxase